MEFRIEHRSISRRTRLPVGSQNRRRDRMLRGPQFGAYRAWYPAGWRRALVHRHRSERVGGCKQKSEEAWIGKERTVRPGKFAERAPVLEAVPKLIDFI